MTCGFWGQLRMPQGYVKGISRSHVERESRNVSATERARVREKERAKVRTWGSASATVQE